MSPDSFVYVCVYTYVCMDFHIHTHIQPPLAYCFLSVCVSGHNTHKHTQV